MLKKKDAKRFKQIVKIFIKYGYDYILEKKQKTGFIPFFKRDEKLSCLSTPQKIRKMFEELGVTFIKLGQMMSTRSDLVGIKIAKELEKLQDGIEAFDYKIAEHQIQNELKSPVSKLFKNFDKIPIASASIGQVYCATLRNQKDEKVIVKIQRPEIKGLIESDLNLMYYLCDIADKHAFSKYGNLRAIIKEFDRVIHKELNFVVEAKNADIFKYNFLNDSNIVIPRVFWDYTTEHILVMEYLEGEKLKDFFNHNRKYRFAIDKEKIAKLQAQCFFKQVYIDGFFNADPHPSNLFILKGNKLGFVDFGMISRISKPMLNKFSNLFILIIDRDIENLVNQLKNIGMIPYDIDICAFKSDIYDLYDYYYNISLKYLQMGKFVKDLLCLFHEYNLKIPRELYLFSRALVYIESNGQKLNKNFNAIQECKPYIKDILKSKVSPKKIAQKIRNSIFDMEYVLEEFPSSFRAFINTFKKKGLIISFEHKNLNILSNELERVSSRISFSMIISAIIVASALIMTSGKGILLFGFPIFGILGFILAAILGFLMILGLLRRGNVY